MSSIFARCIGLSPEQSIPADAAIVLLQRRTKLTRAQARVLVLDYLGWPRTELSEYLGISVATVGTYWKRIYRKTKHHSREAVHAWFEQIIQRELTAAADDQGAIQPLAHTYAE